VIRGRMRIVCYGEFMRQLIFTCLLALLPALLSAGGGDSNEADFFSFERATLEEALNIKTSVSTLSELSLRETPGLVTVITREEIRASGARDLIDVLNMVPEFEFGVDGWGNLGLGVRGNWANEGKVLLLWDGQVYTETLYTNIQFDRFPVDQVEEIAIVKGPGSVIYGGYAELAVIDIKTRAPRNLNGGEAYAAYGQGRAKNRNYSGYSFGRVLEGGAEVSAKAFWGAAQRSDRRYADFSGNSYNMNGASDLRSRSLNLYAAKKDLSLRFITDNHSVRGFDGYGAVLSSGPEKIGFDMVFTEAKYNWRVSPELRIEPRMNFAQGKPWHEDNIYYTFDKTASRLTGGLTAFYQYGPKTSFVAGCEYYHDAVAVGAKTTSLYAYADGRTAAYYDNMAFFGQGTFNLGRLNLIAGGRYDKHSSYGASFVPRLAATKVWDKLSFKAIYSRSFRAPSIENMRVNPAIKPERTLAVEFEAGYKAGENLFLSGNLFQTEITDPILYYSDSVSETYVNYERTGTNGFGLGVRFKKAALRADLNYLQYNTCGNRVAGYSVPGHDAYMLGLPRHKVTVNASVPSGAGFSVNPSAVYISRRYGYAYPGSIRAFKALAIANINFQLKDRPVADLTLSLGVRDIFDSGYSYMQPYASNHAPLPAPSREFFVKAGYEF